MKLTFGDLKKLIREATRDCWAASHPEEMHEQQLEDDPSYKKRSTYVPNDVKRAIKKWTQAMGLSGRKRTNTSRHQ